MIRVEIAKWGQTLKDLRQTSLHAAHARSRERFQALYLIASGQFNATACAAHIGRQDETVLAWVHRYNQFGPDSLLYRRSGGRSPLFLNSRPNRSFRSSKTANPPIRACRATSGPSRNSSNGCSRRSVWSPDATASAAS